MASRHKIVHVVIVMKQDIKQNKNRTCCSLLNTFVKTDMPTYRVFKGYKTHSDCSATESYNTLKFRTYTSYLFISLVKEFGINNMISATSFSFAYGFPVDRLHTHNRHVTRSYNTYIYFSDLLPAC